jgi:hypothetical protein
MASWIYLDGNKKKRASGSILNVVDRVVTIQVEGDSEICQIPLDHLRLTPEESDRVARESAFQPIPDYRMGPPSEKQLKVINRHLPAGVDPFGPEDVVTIPFLIADNLVNRSYDKWTVESLETMATLAPGLPMMKNHDWGDVDTTWGRIYGASVHRTDSPPPGVINRAGLEERNKIVIKAEGYVFVVAEVFALASKSMVLDLFSGHPGGVSTGGFRYKDLHCPICKTSYSDPACPHVPSTPWGPSPSDNELVAPYSERYELFDLGEVSVVTIPKLPGAGLYAPFNYG